MEHYPRRTASTCSLSGLHSANLLTSSDRSCDGSRPLADESVIARRRRLISGSDATSFPTELPRRSKSLNDLDGRPPADEVHHGREVPLPTTFAKRSTSPPDASAKDLQTQYRLPYTEKVNAMIAAQTLLNEALVHINLPPEERRALKREKNMKRFGTTYRK